jgi:hypothetical protein
MRYWAMALRGIEHREALAMPPIKSQKPALAKGGGAGLAGASSALDHLLNPDLSAGQALLFQD